MAGFERVFETGHVYRAEPHASSRHLTEYYSLDVEFGFIDGPEDVIQLERELLTAVFHSVTEECGDILKGYRDEPLPSMLGVPCWEFSTCLELLQEKFGRTDLTDDLDPEGERQLCQLAQAQTGVPAVFVLGFPLAARPFYTAPRGTAGDCIAGKTWRQPCAGAPSIQPASKVTCECSNWACRRMEGSRSAWNA